jgi:acetoin utilization deacetylase AcuC-like enzyme
MHPERPERIPAIEREMDARGWLGLERREAPQAERERLSAVHPESYIDQVEEYCARGAAFDADTPTSPGSWEAALRSAGGACAMVEALMSNGVPYAFNGQRPPGHHAEPQRAMGFCLFANVSIAARHALDSLGAERVFILDWDVHHGNGTQAVWWESPEVLFASIHQWPFYPGTGALGEAGAGEGEGHTINMPVPAGAGHEEFLSLVEHVALPAAREFAPGLILLSAGYDAHRDDPLADCTLTAESYAQMALKVRALASELGAPVGVVLEGGYDLRALAESVAATLEALVGGGDADPVGHTPLSEAAAAQAGRYWKLES